MREYEGARARSEKIVMELPAERRRVNGEDELRGTIRNWVRCRFASYGSAWSDGGVGGTPRNMEAPVSIWLWMEPFPRLSKACLASRMHRNLKIA